MEYETIEVRKVTPGIGAEIHGVDLASPLSNHQFREIHDRCSGSCARSIMR
jgi:taurine dioxygenase